MYLLIDVKLPSNLYYFLHNYSMNLFFVRNEEEMKNLDTNT